MAAWYAAGEYTPLSLPDCLERVKQLVLFFSRRAIGIARIGLQASETTSDASQILAGPYHPAFGHLVHCELFLDMARLLVSDCGGDLAEISFDVHPRSISRARGLRNNNLLRLQNEFGIGDIHTRPDPKLPKDALRLAGSGRMLTYADLRCDILNATVRSKARD